MRHVAIVAKTDKVRRIEHNKPKCCIFERYTSKVTDYIRMHLQTPAIAEYMLFVPNIHEHSLRVPLVEPHHTWAAAGIQDQFVRFHNSHSDLFVCLSLQPHAVGHGPEV